jgi:hypothetical protein
VAMTYMHASLKLFILAGMSLGSAFVVLPPSHVRQTHQRGAGSGPASGSGFCVAKRAMMLKMPLDVGSFVADRPGFGGVQMSSTRVDAMDQVWWEDGQGIHVEEAEEWFVDEEENLEEGEELVKAVKSFDRGILLCAGALTRRTCEDGKVIYDMWLGDSIEKGVGANLQIKG